MSGYRLTGGICALVFAALLAYVVVISFGPESMVTPSVTT